jgi:hypothetical protein
MKKVLRWIGRRLRERSTYAGIGMIATVAGAPSLGVQIDHVGQAVGLIVGGGLAAATTKSNPFPF